VLIQRSYLKLSSKTVIVKRHLDASPDISSLAQCLLLGRRLVVFLSATRKFHSEYDEDQRKDGHFFMEHGSSILVTKGWVLSRF